MLNFTRLAISAAIVTACTNSAFGAEKAPEATSYAARTPLSRVVTARTELAQDTVFKSSDITLLVTAQATLAASVAQLTTAKNRATALEAIAEASRRTAYAVSNQLGLSAAENQKMVAAMETADAAENVAADAQTSESLVALAVTRQRQDSVALTAQIAALDEQIDACDAFLRSNGIIVLQPARRPMPRG